MPRHIRKGDLVRVIRGSDSKRPNPVGKVLEVLPGGRKAIVQGINVRRKSVKPSQANQQGGDRQPLPSGWPGAGHGLVILPVADPLLRAGPESDAPWVVPSPHVWLPDWFHALGWDAPQGAPSPAGDRSGPGRPTGADQ